MLLAVLNMLIALTQSQARSPFHAVPADISGLRDQYPLFRSHFRKALHWPLAELRHEPVAGQHGMISPHESKTLVEVVR